MNKYPALRIVSSIYRVFGILAGFAVMFMAALSMDAVTAIIGFFLGIIVGATLYAVGEFILLMIRSNQYQYHATEALVKMSKGRNVKSRHIKSLKKGA